MEVIPTNFKLNNNKHIVRIQTFNALLHEWLEDLQPQMGSATPVTIIKTLDDIMSGKEKQNDYYFDELHL